MFIWIRFLMVALLLFCVGCGPSSSSECPAKSTRTHKTSPPVTQPRRRTPSAALSRHPKKKKHHSTKKRPPLNARTARIHADRLAKFKAAHIMAIKVLMDGSIFLNDQPIISRAARPNPSQGSHAGHRRNRYCWRTARVFRNTRFFRRADSQEKTEGCPQGRKRENKIAQGEVVTVHWFSVPAQTRKRCGSVCHLFS